MRITCDVHSDESICVWSSFPKCVERSKFEEVQLFVQLRLFRGVFARVRGIWHMVKYIHTRVHRYSVVLNGTVWIERFEILLENPIFQFARNIISYCFRIRRVKLMDNRRIESKDGSLVFVKKINSHKIRHKLTLN